MISINEANASGTGFNAGWLASLRFPRGNYVVYATATFWRRDVASQHGTARVHCGLVGLDGHGILDRTNTVEFFIHPPELEPDPSVTVPFTAAGRGTDVHLKCNWGGPLEILASNIHMNAISVDELHRQ